YRASVKWALGADRLAAWVGWGLDTEGLARQLWGGGLPGAPGTSPVCEDADDLLSILGAIQPESLPHLKSVVEQHHGGVRRWAAQALRLPGWSRQFWVWPLVALLQRSHGSERRSIAMKLRLL